MFSEFQNINLKDIKIKCIIKNKKILFNYKNEKFILLTFGLDAVENHVYFCKINNNQKEKFKLIKSFLLCDELINYFLGNVHNLNEANSNKNLSKFIYNLNYLLEQN